MDWWIIARDTSVSTYLPTCHLPRLDTSLKKYNEAIARNKRLRESIDGLRRERLVFDQIYAKLEREMAEKKREMARIAEASNRASLALSSFTIPTLSPTLTPTSTARTLPTLTRRAPSRPRTRRTRRATQRSTRWLASRRRYGATQATMRTMRTIRTTRLLTMLAHA